MTLDNNNKSNIEDPNFRQIDVGNDPNAFWRIKYRPKKINEIKMQYRKIFGQLEAYLQSGNIPHLMLVGPEGSGKSVLAEIFSRELLGNEFDLNYKMLFADDPIGKDERKENLRQGRISKSRVGSGAGAVRRYRPFIQMRVRPFVSSKKFGAAPFKILVIKSFDRLDVEQQAFRRIIEKYSKNCRMILITDRVSNIIDPILSRCQLLLVPFVPKHLYTKFLKSVCEKEQVAVNLDILNYVRYLTNNNLGKSLDLLQLTFSRFKTISIDNLSKTSHEINYKVIRELFTQTISGNFKAIRKTLREIFRSNNLSKNEILLELSRTLLNLPLERDIRAFYLDLIAQTDFESIDSNDDEIQLEKLLSQMAYIGKYNK
jgi:replication factor C small subunit